MAVNINVPSQVKTYANLAAFPATGALKTIYIAEDTNKTYRWTGSVYVEVSASAASGITIGSTAITSGSVGSILFEGTGNVVQESGNLFWDNTNGRLGIRTSTPANTLDVVGGQLIKATADGFESIKLQNFANTYFNTISFYKSNGTTQTVVLGDNGASVSYPFLTGMRADYGFVGNKNSGFHIFAGTNIAQTIHTTGNVGINTTTDAGFRLDVNGTARVSDLTIGTPSVDNNIRFGGNNTRIFNSIADNSLNYQSVFSASTVFRFTTNSSLPNANTSGTNVFMSLPIGFAPTSGTGTWSQLSLTPTINQTGGANGITRGLYVNPTLTSAADFRAIETTAGRVIFGNLPTSSAGLPTGAIWNDAGTLKIV